MEYIALENFSGIISMVKGEIRVISNNSLANDLMNAKLIKKYVPSDSTEIQVKLNKTNKRIAELEEENKSLKTNIVIFEAENIKLKEELKNLKSNLEASIETSKNLEENESTRKNTTKNSKK